MRRWVLSCYALGLGVAAASLAACGRPQLPINAPVAPLQRGATELPRPLKHGMTEPTFRVVYRFHGLYHGDDGAHPHAGLIYVSGKFYGTSQSGGSGCYIGYKYSQAGCGTVFSISARGRERILYRFTIPDGSNPNGLIDVNGTLYGTTTNGGKHKLGTVFSLTTSGVETVLHSFTGADGAYPEAGLIDVNGTLYGTTYEGGKYSDGIVFSVSTSGAEKLLHSFAGHPDGAFPQAGLVSVNGKLYGTTYSGGSKYRNGTVFRVSTTGEEKVLHAFSTDDGAGPRAGLIDVNGTLYGTTTGGGRSGCGGYGCGTVFRISKTGREKVLYIFNGGVDGGRPVAGLIDVNGMLYGTTIEGGGSGCGHFGAGCGTIFSVSPAGSETVLHSFAQRADGVQPGASLIDVKGTLYGTTEGGGFRCGDYFPKSHCGTVFALTP